MYPEEHGLNEEAMSTFYPQVSDDYFLYFGERHDSWDHMEALLIAAYNEPKSPQIS